ncbi:MAG: hypothetical protein ACFCGT_28095 [Sandaracinaceae bacterium]
MKRAWLPLLLFAACACGAPEPGPSLGNADAGRVEDDLGDQGPDAAPDLGRGVVDGGKATDAAVPVPLTEYDERFGGAFLCFDGLDNDANTQLDCQDPSCRANVPACCVGVSSAECCAREPAGALPDLAGCSGDATACAALQDLVVIGPSPRIVARPTGGRVLRPGSGEADSGLVLPGTFDLRAGAVEIRASLVAPESTCEECLDAMAVALVPAEPSDGRLPPALAVALRGSDGVLSLVLRGDVVQRWAVPTGGAVDLVIRARPDRTATVAVLRPGGAIVPLAEGLPMASPDRVRVATYGRSDRGDEDGAAVEALSAEVERCDMPDALSRTSDTVLPAPGLRPWGDDRTRIAEASVFRDGERTRMAVAVDREIYLAEAVDDGFEPHDLPSLADLDAEWAEDGVGDPNVLMEPTGELVLYFTGRLGDRGTVARAPYDADRDAFDGSAAEVVLAPQDHPGVRAFEDPSVVRRSDGTLLMALRVVEESGAHRIAVLRSADGTFPDLGDAVREPSGAFGGFDRDEVSGPELVSSGGVLRLYYAGRRGTRWGIGLMVSDDLTGWLDLGEILGPGQTGFDALGVLDPAPCVDGGEVTLFYTGFDGTRSRIGAARPATR